MKFPSDRPTCFPRPKALPAIILANLALIALAHQLAGEEWQVPALRADQYGDLLPAGALARMGTNRLWHSALTTFAFSPDSKILATAGTLFEKEQSNICLWEAATGKRLAQLSVGKGMIARLAFSGDGKTLACLEFTDPWQTVDKDGKLPEVKATRHAVTVWDVPTGKPRRAFSYEGAADDRFAPLALSPDGALIAAAAGSEENTRICLWNTADGKKVRSFAPRVPYARDLVFSADTKRLLSTNDPFARLVDLAADDSPAPSKSRYQSACIWDLATGRLLKQRKFADEIASIFFSRTGQALAVTSGGEIVGVAEVGSGKKVATVRFPKAPANEGVSFEGPFSVACALDTRALARVDGHHVTICAIDSPRKRLTFDLERAIIQSAGLSPDGRILALRDVNDTIRICDARTGTERPAFRRHVGPVHAVAISPDGKRLGSAAWSFPFPAGESKSPDRTLQLWDTADGRHVLDLDGLASCVAFSPDGKKIASGGIGGFIRLWDAGNGKQLRKVQAHLDAVSCVTFSHDGKKLISGGWQDRIHVWDCAAAKRLLEIKNSSAGCSRKTECLALSPDGKLLASVKGPIPDAAIRPSAEDWLSYKSVQIWDLTSGKLRRELLTREEHVTAVAFSPNGTTVASAGRAGMIQFWATATGKEVLHIQGPKRGILSLAFSPDGRTLAAGGRDWAVGLWDTTTGKSLTTFQGHEGDVTTVAFFPDGKRLATGSADTTILVWNVASAVERE